MPLPKHSFSIGQQNSQVSQIVPSGSGHNRIPHGLKKRVGIKTGQVDTWVQSAGFGALQSAAVHDRSGGGAIAVNPVGARAEHGNGFAGDFRRAGQGELLIASAYASIFHLHRNFAA